MMTKVGTNLSSCYMFVFLAAAVLYIATCAPGVVWQDSGVIQYRVWHNDIEGRLGLALSHPLYYLVAIAAKHIPFGEFAYRINVLTAAISALAVANLFLLLRLWLGETFAAWLGAATLALSHTFWRHATIPETYGLAVALLLFELIVLLQYAKTSRIGYLYLLALINGLAIANHMLASLAFVCYLVLAVFLLTSKQIKVRNLVVMAIVWIAGALPYEYLIIKNIFQSGEFWGTLASAAFGTRWQGDVFNTSLTGQIVKETFMYLILNFPTPNLLFVFVGVLSIYKISPAPAPVPVFRQEDAGASRGGGPKRWFANVLVALLLLYFIFAFRYTVPDRYAFFIPFYCLVSVLIGLGAYRYLSPRRFASRNEAAGGAIGFLFAAFCLVPVPFYILAPRIAEGLEVKIGAGRKIDYRDDATYFLRPWRIGDIGAERFATEALFSARPPAVIYADATTAPPLLYVQEVQKKRLGDDIKIISSIGSSIDSPELNPQTIETLLEGYAVYVVSPAKGYCPDFLLNRYDFEPAGILWKAVEKK